MVKNVIFEILWEEIEQKPYNMLYNHLFQLLEHILTLLMFREASLLDRYYWKLPKLVQICGILKDLSILYLK